MVTGRATHQHRHVGFDHPDCVGVGRTSSSRESTTERGMAYRMKYATEVHVQLRGVRMRMTTARIVCDNGVPGPQPYPPNPGVSSQTKADPAGQP
jgi:hypothetical protein